ncbi:peptidoglycan-associated lipoprotein Pal [uncultured Desulfosarcina sp.]|uniref:peptidoglycan-associated lipoprotein Pal n=1 Tax=uncultured Desulfosarcina sp. TaxID=218289 RepID=UPI0029C68120|nr:peptidoglycan-associated lipoprotein Pal [uncultured Desulfosarcina sp.]
MKRNLVVALILMMIVAMVFLTTSCAKEAVQSQPETISQPEAPVASEEPAQTAEQAEPPAEVPAPVVTDAAVVNEKIYFGFDSAALSDQAPPILARMADYLRTNPNLSVTVQGHCDERGTKAYNMGLGTRRAEAVKTYLVDQGVQADRLATMSYGEARPAAIGQNETAWTQNRRAEFVVD